MELSLINERVVISHEVEDVRYINSIQSREKNSERLKETESYKNISIENLNYKNCKF